MILGRAIKKFQTLKGFFQISERDEVETQIKKCDRVKMLLLSKRIAYFLIRSDTIFSSGVNKMAGWQQ